MADKSKRITDEQMSQNTSDAVETVCKAIKEASGKIFDSLVERTSEVFSDMFDRFTDKAKEKIVTKGAKNEKTDNVP